MKYCKKCIMPDTRPGLVLDEEGVCQGCRYYENIHSIDWTKRKKELTEVIQFARANSSMGYDAVMTVSGGKDSTRQALYARDELGLNCLLATTQNPPEMVTEIGVANIENLTKLGFDTISITPDPQTFKKLMKKSFIEHGNYNKSVENVMYSAVHRLAMLYDIPLIIMGENGSIVYGDPASRNDGGNAQNLRNLNTLRGGTDYMVDKTQNIDHRDVYLYKFPMYNTDKLKAIYLGYYIKDFSQIVNGLFSMAFGLKYRIEGDPRDIGMLYNFSQSDTNFVQVNQLIKYYKFGFGKATEDISELIKLGIMERETGVKIAREIDGKVHPKYIKEFCDFIDMDIETFWEIAESYINKEIFAKKDGEWQLKNQSFKEIV